MSHRREDHPLAGQDVTARSPDSAVDGVTLRVENWWTLVAGKSWRDLPGNPVCLTYRMRRLQHGFPDDDDVVYGKISGYGVLVHASEIAPDEAST